MAYRAFLLGRNTKGLTSCYSPCQVDETDDKAQTEDEPLKECDVRKMRDVLRACGYEVCVAKASWRTSGDILSGLDAFLNKTDKEDNTILFYYSGHAYIGSKGLQFQLVEDPKSEPAGMALLASAVIQEIDACTAQHKIIIVDSCYAGAAASTKYTAYKDGMYFLTATDDNSRTGAILTEGGRLTRDIYEALSDARLWTKAADLIDHQGNILLHLLWEWLKARHEQRQTPYCGPQLLPVTNPWPKVRIAKVSSGRPSDAIELGVAVSDDRGPLRNFFGRGEQKNQIIRSLENTKDHRVLIVQGERRMGKTSMLDLIKQELEARHDSHLKVGPVEEGKLIRSASRFFERMIRQAEGFDGAPNPFEGATDPSGQVDQAVEVVKDLLKKQPDCRLVMIVDEFDECLVGRQRGQSRLPESDRGAILWLVERVAKECKIRFLFSIIRVTIRFTDWDARDFVSDTELVNLIALKPFSSKSESEYLEYNKMVVALLHRALDTQAPSLTAEDLQELHRQTGGWHFFTKIVLTHLVDAVAEGRPGGLAAALIQAASAQQDTPLTTVMQHIFASHMDGDELGAFRRLANRDGAISTEDLCRLSLTAPDGANLPAGALRLVHRYYLKEEIDHKTKDYDFKVELLRAWFVNWREIPGNLQKVTDGSEPQKRGYQVALSFSEEHRDLAEQVAKELMRQKFQKDEILYDEWWRSKLATFDFKNYLLGLYKNRSGTIILFLCEARQTKKWCKLEWAAIEDVINERPDRVMVWRPSHEFLWDGPDGEVIAGKKPAEISRKIIEFYRDRCTATADDPA
jgi:hypothetical protein